MAQDRTNMVSLLDIGKLFGNNTSNIVELGDGFKEITEDWGPQTESTQYVNMKTAASTVKGYDLSMDLEREYLSDSVQAQFDKMFKKFPTGSDCETFYYRFYKSDLTESSGSYSGPAIKVPVSVCPSSTGGAGGDILTSTLNIKGRGDAVEGTITISSTGEYSFS